MATSPLSPADWSEARSWGVAPAAHLLRRLQTGYRPEDLRRVMDEGPEQTVERLLTEHPEDPSIGPAIASLEQTALATGQIDSLRAAWLLGMTTPVNPLREKLTLMWHNHFATSYGKVKSLELMRRQIELFRRHAWGNFGALLHEVSRDPAMLVWLDGNSNRKRHPNENYARELMELFSLGVGNYTEHDIQEAARAFSGWHMRHGDYWFNSLQHDDTEKTVFGKTGRFGGDEVVDLCLEQDACPRFVANRLLQTFVHPRPPEEWTAAVADDLRRENFELQPVLRRLFLSSAFYSNEARNSLIKSPVDYVLGSMTLLGVAIRWPETLRLLSKLGQNVYEPPSVKGWDGQRNWVTSTTLMLRTQFVADLIQTNQYGVASPSKVLESADLPKVLATVLGSEDPQLLASVREQMTALSKSDSKQRLTLLMQLPEYHLY